MFLYQMKKEKKTGSMKDLKYNSLVYLKRTASSVREILKSRFLNNCGKQKMNKEKERNGRQKFVSNVLFVIIWL